jgi:peptidoglycan/LPS O-acetylase OafA/YrhL
MTLGGSLSGRDNALNFVRIVLATTVIVSHSWPTGGFGTETTFGGLNLGGWAVAGFFTISGYLICASRSRLSLGPFIRARALRIFPAYWTALVAVAVIFAPLGALLTSTKVDLRGGAWYVLSNLTTVVATPAFGDAIHRTAYPYPVWDGPIWTLQYELLCYVIVGAAFCVRRIRTDPSLFSVGLFTAATVVNCLLTSGGMQGRGWSMGADFSRMGAYFAAGAVLWVFREKIRATGPWPWFAAASLLGLAVTHHADDVGALPLAYLALWAGARLPVPWGRRTDLSYGVYVYGWPVQSVLSLAGGAVLGPLGFAVVALLITAGLAVLSWRFVERPALRLRSRNERHPSREGEGHLGSGSRAGLAEAA